MFKNRITVSPCLCAEDLVNPVTDMALSLIVKICIGPGNVYGYFGDRAFTLPSPPHLKKKID